MSSVLIIGLALGLFLFPALPAEAAQKYCEAEVKERLDRLNASPSNIRGIYYDAQHHNSRKTDRRPDFLAWVSTAE